MHQMHKYFMEAEVTQSKRQCWHKNKPVKTGCRIKKKSGIQKEVTFRRVEARDLTNGFKTKLDKFMKQLM